MIAILNFPSYRRRVFDVRCLVIYLFQTKLCKLVENVLGQPTYLAAAAKARRREEYAV